MQFWNTYRSFVAAGELRGIEEGSRWIQEMDLGTLQAQSFGHAPQSVQGSTERTRRSRHTRARSRIVTPTLSCKKENIIKTVEISVQVCSTLKLGLYKIC